MHSSKGNHQPKEHQYILNSANSQYSIFECRRLHGESHSTHNGEILHVRRCPSHRHDIRRSKNSLVHHGCLILPESQSFNLQPLSDCILFHILTSHHSSTFAELLNSDITHTIWDYPLMSCQPRSYTTF